MITFKRFLEERLVVARKRSNGKVQVGKPGWIHADLLSTREYDNEHHDGEMGFVAHGDKKKKFMTRDQAHAYMKKNHPDNIRKRKISTFHSSDIKDHDKVRSK